MPCPAEFALLHSAPHHSHCAVFRKDAELSDQGHRRCQPGAAADRDKPRFVIRFASSTRRNLRGRGATYGLHDYDQTPHLWTRSFWMTFWLTLLATLLFIAALVWRRRHGLHAPQNKEPDSVQPYQAVSIRPGMNACTAVWMKVGERYLLEDAPELPVAGCDKTQCDCSLNPHEDRREPGERRSPELALDDDAADAPLRHRSPGRREEDQTPAPSENTER